MNRTPCQQFRHRSPAASRHRQRGVAAVFSAIAIVALFASLALAIDVGQLFYAQRDLEKEASLAAITGAQSASGCRATAGVPANLAGVTAAVINSIALNLPTGAAAPAATAELGWVNDFSGQTLIGINNSAVIFASPNDGKRHFFALSGTDPNVSPKINSVRVTLTRPQPALLIPFLSAPGATPQLSASAVAEQQALGSFNIGTTLASLNTANAGSIPVGPLSIPIGPLLCQTSSACLAKINLTAAGFQGLLNTSVSLGQIAEAVGVTDLSSLLTTSTTLPSILNGLSPLIDGATAGTGSIVSGLLAVPASGAVDLGDIFSTVAGSDLNAPVINLFDLLTALAEDAIKNSSGGIVPITLPVNTNLNAVATVNSFLKVGAPAQPGGLAPAGVAKASTAEITLMIRIQAGSLLSGLTSAINGLLSGLLGNLLGITVTTVQPPLNIGIDVGVAPASATLNTLQCPDMTLAAPIAKLSTITSIATIAVGTFSSSALTAPVSQVGSIPLATVKINNILLGSDTETLSLAFTSAGIGTTSAIALAPVTQFHSAVQENGDPLSSLTYVANGFAEAPVIDNPQTVGSPVNLALSVGLNASSPDNGKGLSALGLSTVNNLVSGLLSGVLAPLVTGINTLASTVINPLLAELGIQAGASTVTMNSVVTGAPVVVVTSQVPVP
jgi:hypothetical protein